MGWPWFIVILINSIAVNDKKVEATIKSISPIKTIDSLRVDMFFTVGGSVPLILLFSVNVILALF